MEGREKRAYARISLADRFTVRLGETKLALPVRDISLGGVFLYTDDSTLSVSTLLTVEIPYGQPPLEMAAEVVRVIPVPDHPERNLGVGLRWSESSEKARAQLVRIIDGLLEKPSGKRSAPRIHALVQVACLTNRSIEMILRDIGHGGMALMADRTLEVDSEIEIELEIPGQEPVRLRGKVRRVDAPRSGELFRRVGVQFTSMPSEARAALRQGLMRMIR
jgi:c-di-GMP-binding flagellar brake protein YcgR